MNLQAGSHDLNGIKNSNHDRGKMWNRETYTKIVTCPRCGVKVTRKNGMIGNENMIVRYVSRVKVREC
ncbi:MAG: hypothetical protein ACLTZT_00135 [Butyricimonas faecalis]